MTKWDRPCYKCLSHFCDLSCKEPEHLKPPQRTWVGLTDEERIMCRSYDIDQAIANTEAKLKEKNT
jgi:hypothetical protein